MADISITAASVLPSAAATKDNYVAGEAITAGQGVYIAADGSVKKCDADGTTPSHQLCGIACNSAPGVGQHVEVCTADPAFTIGGTVAVGDVIIASATAGGLCVVNTTTPQPTTGWKVAIAGVAISATQIYLRIVRTDAAKA